MVPPTILEEQEIERTRDVILSLKTKKFVSNVQSQHAHQAPTKQDPTTNTLQKQQTRITLRLRNGKHKTFTPREQLLKNLENTKTVILRNRYKSLHQIHPVMWNSCSKATHHSRLALAPFASLTHVERIQAFETAASSLGWDPATQETYFSHVLAFMTAAGEQIHVSDKKYLKILKSKTECRMKEISYSATQEDIHLYRSQHQGPLKIAVVLSFRLGLRIGDFLQLAAGDIRTVSLTAANMEPTEFLQLHFRRGKTVPKTGTFVINVPLTIPEARELGMLAASLQSQSLVFHPEWLVSQLQQYPEAWQREKTALSRTVTKQLQKIDPRLCIKAVRRGGLSWLESQGLSLDSLKNLSRHKSDKVLLHYLKQGGSLTQQARELAAIYKEKDI